MAKLSELKYLRKVPRSNRRHHWVFEPPQDAIDAGAAKRVTFEDGRTARKEVPALVDAVVQYLNGERPGTIISGESTFNQVVAHYLNTRHFDSLAKRTKEAYRTGFRRIGATRVTGGLAGNTRMRKFDAQMCQEMYDSWCKTSVANGKQTATHFGIIVSYCMSLDILDKNPMSKIKKASHEVRSVVWTPEQVEKFLDVAFSDFKYRNVGLVVLMCYEWAQRPIDIQTLTWDSLDLENGVATIKQKKRGAVVTLPIDEGLLNMLKEQHDDFGFQNYVVPVLRHSDKAWRPYTSGQFSRVVAEIKQKAGLPQELRVGDLRKTAIMETIEAGVDTTAIMSVTGHKNLASLSPYVKHSFKAAQSALSQRRKNKT